MRKPLLPLLALTGAAIAVIGSGVTGIGFPVAPHVTLATPRPTYRVGEPMPITYRVVNATAIPMRPMPGCTDGSDYDFGVQMLVRHVGGNPKAERARIGWQAAESYSVNQFIFQDTVNVNDGVSIACPGTYQITVYVDVSRPVSHLRDLHSNTVTIRVTDTPAAHAKRKMQVASVAAVLRDADATPQTKASAIATLRYNSEPEALPVLLDAFGSSDAPVREAAHAPLFLWHDPQAAYDGACAWLQSHPYKPGSENGWEQLIADSEIRAGSYFCGESFDDAQQRAAIAVSEWRQR